MVILAVSAAEANLPVRTKAQKTGEAGQNFVREVIDSHLNWMCRAQDLDFGVDLEAEFAPSIADQQQPTGNLLKLQVKASQNIVIERGTITVVLDHSYLDYVLQFRLPVILIAVDVNKREAWWIWLQSWFIDHEVSIGGVAKTATLRILIPASQTLASGLNNEWKNIASVAYPAVPGPSKCSVSAGLMG